MQALWASLCVTAIGSSVLWCATDSLQAVTAEGARRVSVLRVKPAVTDVGLETMLGSTTRLIDGGKFTFVEFIYTRCPTICRTTGTNLARLRDRLASDGLSNRVRILSISFDPRNDDKSALASYGKAHGANGEIWTVARSSPADLLKLLGTFGVVVIPDAFGGFEHNAALHIVDPTGRLVSILDIDDIDGAVSAVRKAAS